MSVSSIPSGSFDSRQSPCLTSAGEVMNHSLFKSLEITRTTVSYHIGLTFSVPLINNSWIRGYVRWVSANLLPQEGRGWMLTGLHGTWLNTSDQANKPMCQGSCFTVATRDQYLMHNESYVPLGLLQSPVQVMMDKTPSLGRVWFILKRIHLLLTLQTVGRLLNFPLWIFYKAKCSLSWIHIQILSNSLFCETRTIFFCKPCTRRFISIASDWCFSFAWLNITRDPLTRSVTDPNHSFLGSFF